MASRNSPNNSKGGVTALKDSARLRLILKKEDEVMERLIRTMDERMAADPSGELLDKSIEYVNEQTDEEDETEDK